MATAASGIPAVAPEVASPPAARSLPSRGPPAAIESSSAESSEAVASASEGAVRAEVSAPTAGPLLVSLPSPGLAIAWRAEGIENDTPRDPAADSDGTLVPEAMDAAEVDVGASTRGSAARRPKTEEPAGHGTGAIPIARPRSHASHPSAALAAGAPAALALPETVHGPVTPAPEAAPLGVPVGPTGDQAARVGARAVTPACPGSGGVCPTSSVRLAIAIISSCREASSEKRFPKLPPLKSRASF